MGGSRSRSVVVTSRLAALWLLVVGAALELGGGGVGLRGVLALRMINLDAPEAALQGDTIRLACFFELHGQHSAGPEEGPPPPLPPEVDNKQLALVGQQEQVYAIKWYKDEREFYRYVAQEWQKKRALPVDGLTVDVEASDNRTVVLTNVTLKAAGQFRCEVSTEAPTFVTKSLERKLLIHSHDNNNNSSNSRALPFATIKSQRFVRLTPPTGGKTLAGGLKGPSSRYELLAPDGSGSMVARPAAQVDPLWPETLRAQQQQAVELEAGLLVQLAEATSSRLNLTVDSNLLQLLSQTSRQPAPALKGPAKTPLPAPTHQHQQHQHQPLQLSPQPVQVVAGKAGIKQKADQRQQQSTGVGQPQKGRTVNRLASPAPGPNQSAPRLTLKVRCSARVLHLIMSDEIKLRLIDKPSGSQQPQQMEQLAKQHTNSAATSLGISGILSFITITLLFNISFLLK